MKEIKLTGKRGLGKVAIVDDDTPEWILKKKWYMTRQGYAGNDSAVTGRLLLHMAVMGAKGCDHINRDRLDCRKTNIRICTQHQNCFNQPPRKGTSRFKGVHWRKDTYKWAASITCNRHTYCIGSYKSEIDAACAYDNAARKMFGEYAYLNFP